MKLKVEKMVCCTDSYVLCYAYMYSSKHIFRLCIILSCISSKKYSKFILAHTFLVLVTVGLGHGVYRKLYTLIGGQRAEKFENHCFILRRGDAKLRWSNSVNNYIHCAFLPEDECK